MVLLLQVSYPCESGRMIITIVTKIKNDNG